MKPHASLARSLTLVACLSLAVPLLAANTPKKSGAPAKQTDTPAATAPSAADEENPENIKLPGTVLNRPNGEYLTVEVVDGKLKLGFYNAKKKPTAPDVARALARWNPPTKTGSQRCVLNLASDGVSLTGSVFVSPPYKYPIYITLVPAEGEATETYTVHYSP